jgi:calcineurin-like phosphoesterase family protein
MRYWASDLHVGHANIIKYCNRPWANVDEMNEGLIARWNHRVLPEDEVFFLGDFTIGLKPAAAAEFARRLNGTKIWIPGNHDSHKLMKELSLVGFMPVAPIHEISEQGQHIVMCHYPMLRWNKSSHGSWMLHGHSHGGLSYPFDGKIGDVSLDAWDWYPATFHEIKAKIDGKPIVHETDRKDEAR